MFFKEKLVRSQTSFYFGFACGVAAVALLGFLVFGGLVVKKELASGDGFFADDGEAADIADVVDAGSDNAKPSQPDSAAKVDVKVAASDHIRGNKNAKITIVEFSDYQCPFCSRFHDTMKQVMAKYPNQVRWVFKHFPLESIHPYARKAALAAECAGEQNKFWEYSDAIYANQASLNDDYLTTAAKNLRLDTKKFGACLSSEKYASKVNADLQQGQGYGVRGTPGSFINGQTIPGAVPFEQVDSMIENLL